MTDINIRKIIERLDDHEERLRELEAHNIDSGRKIGSLTETKKQLTLAEIIKNKKFKSGQEKVAVIVGYYENILKINQIKESSLKEGWKSGKFDGKYNHNLLTRALKKGLVRKIDGNLDLSQTGEKFWDDFIK